MGVYEQVERTIEHLKRCPECGGDLEAPCYGDHFLSDLSAEERDALPQCHIDAARTDPYDGDDSFAPDVSICCCHCGFFLHVGFDLDVIGDESDTPFRRIRQLISQGDYDGRRRLRSVKGES